MAIVSIIFAAITLVMSFITFVAFAITHVYIDFEVALFFLCRHSNSHTHRQTLTQTPVG